MTDQDLVARLRESHELLAIHEDWCADIGLPVSIAKDSADAIERLTAEVEALKSRNVPILLNHDHQQPPIGLVKMIDGALHVEFRQDLEVSREMAFAIFGNAGLRIVEGDGMIKRASILEFSLSPDDAARSA